MEQSSRSNATMVTDGRIRGTQENTTSLPGKTQAGRNVQCKVTAVQTSCQGAAASNTSQRTARNCAVAAAPAPARTADSTGESRVFAIKSSVNKPTDELQTMVGTSLAMLNKAKQMHGENSLLFCLDVTKQLDILTKKLKTSKNSSRDYEFVTSQLGPQYACSLHPALETLQSIADNKRSWEHYKDLISVVKYLYLRQDKYTWEDFDREWTWKLCKQFLHNEIHYLEHIKDLPVAEVANGSSEIVDHLINFLLKCPHCNFMPRDELKNIKKKKNRLMNIIQSNGNKGSAGEHIQKMEKDFSTGFTDIQDKRRYNDLLKVRFLEIVRKNGKKDANIQERFLMLKELCTLRKKCLHFTGEFHVALYNITATISGIAKQILNQGMDNFVQAEEDVLNFIYDLMFDGLLSDECSRLYLRCSEAQAAMRAVPQTNRITIDQCTKQLDEIDLLAKKGTEDHAMQAAVMLGELLHGHWHDIKDLDTADELIRHINDIEFMLFMQLFKPVVDKFKEYKTAVSDLERYNLDMSRLRHRVMKLSPYTFVIRNKEHIMRWHKAACAAWYCDLEKLSRKKSFTVEDIDCLLDLKHTEPDVLNLHVRGLLEETCGHLFQAILENKNHDEKIPFEKLAMLHQWINEIAILQKVSRQQREQQKAELKKINEAWKRKYPDTTARIVSDQPVSDAVLIRLEPEELFPSESKSSPTPPTKASAATISRPDVICPESQADLERGKSLAAGFSETPEQLAGATTTMAMVTAQVPQAAPFSLQDAGQPSFKTTDERAPQSTVTAPVEMMTAAGKMDDMTARRSVQETQNSMTLSPEKAQTEKIAPEVKAIRIPGQMAATSNTSRQTTSDDCAMAAAEPITPETAWRSMDVEESRTFKIAECKYQPTKMFRSEISASLTTLKKKKDRYGEKSLQFCQAVVTELDRLNNKFDMHDDAESDDYKFMEYQLAPYYVNSLRPALDALKSEANEQRAWEHYQDFMSLMKYFYLQTDETSMLANTELMKDIYQQLLENELAYQNYASNIPLVDITTYSSLVINRLLNKKTCQLHKGSFLLISEEMTAKIDSERKRLRKAVSAHTENGSIDEHIKKLEEKMRTGNAGTLDKRLYDDLLRVQIKNLGDIKNKNSHELFLILEKIYELHQNCLTFLGKSALAINDAKVLISRIVGPMLKKSMDNVVPLEKEVLDFIGRLMTNNMLGGKCKQLYLACKESQAGMDTATPTEKITDAQCTQKLTSIRSLLENKNRANLLTAAEMLRQLLHEHWDEITKLPKANSHISDIKSIRNTLCMELFQPLIDKFNKHEALTRSRKYNKEYNAEMDNHRPVFVELNPYTYVLINKQRRSAWIRAACAAWHHTLETLIKKESFRESDVDHLIDLKHIAPGMPNPHIRILLGQALENLLSCMLDGRACNIPREKLATISQWVEDLVHVKSINKQQQKHDDTRLEELNDAWKGKIEDTTVRVTSDQPAPDAALVRSEPGELSSFENGSSFMPPTKASAATASGTDVVSP